MLRLPLIRLFFASIIPVAPLSADPPKHESRQHVGEWKKCKFTHPLDGEEQEGYVRFTTATSYRGKDSGSSSHGVVLDHGFWLNVEEWDSQTGLIAKLVRNDSTGGTVEMKLEKKLNRNGLPRRHEVGFGRVYYVDLNGDGTIDAWVDNRGPSRHSLELRDLRVVEVGDTKVPFLDFGEPVPASKLPGATERPKPRVLGPKWVRIKTINPDAGFEQISYLRPGANVSYRKNNDDTTRHTLILDQGGGIDVYERDDRSAVTIELIGKKPGDRLFSFSRQVNEKGKPTRHEARFGPVTYFDLDGDGMIDCWVDRRNNKPESFILFERRVVKIEDPNAMLFAKPKGVYSAWSHGRKSEYEFIVPVAKWIPAKP